jgi:peroxiredoxin
MNVNVGDPAPDFTLRDQNNDEWTLSAHRGENVVLVFYPLDFSPTCTKELKDLTAVADKYGAAGAEVVGISVDSRWTHAAFKQHEDLAATLLADFHPRGEVARLYEAFLDGPGFATRATYIIDKDGVIAHKVVTSPGEARNQDEYLEALAACPV